MRKIIKVLVGVSLFATIFTPNIKIENTTNSSLIEYASDNFNKGKVDIKRLENVSNDTSYAVGSTMYVQMGENETSKFLRFATPIKGNPNKVEYTRTYDKDGTTDQKSKEVSTVYPGIRSGEKDFYYNDEGLTETKPETIEYYWACYTIEFRGEKIINDYLTKDFTLELKVNDNKVELSRTSCLYANQSLISLKNDDDFNVFVDKSKKYDFAGKTISLDYERNVEITEVLYPDTSLKFNGTFDGKGNKLNLNLEKANTVALFGYVGNEGTVKNLTTTGIVKATDTSVNSDVAGIASINYGTIDTCTNEAKIDVQGKGYGGGIVSQNAGGAKIINCTNNGGIGKYNETGLTEGGFMLGGIAGRSNQDSLIENCKNYGEIKGGAGAGANGGVGGIVGVIAGATIKGCLNGKEDTAIELVSSKGNLGGIVGSIQANSSTIENCTNYMKISAEAGYVGGIIGCSLKWTSIAITGCENRGSVESNARYLGGIIGNAYCKVGSTKKDDILITNCINFKNVICKNETLDSFYLGGIAGSIANTTISSSCVEEHVEMTYGKTTKLITEFSMRYSGSTKPLAYIIAGKATTQAKGDNVIDNKSGICDANGTFLRTSGKGN